VYVDPRSNCSDADVPSRVNLPVFALTEKKGELIGLFVASITSNPKFTSPAHSLGKAGLKPSNAKELTASSSIKITDGSDQEGDGVLVYTYSSKL
jgi:hypothetical protein